MPVAQRVVPRLRVLLVVVACVALVAAIVVGVRYQSRHAKTVAVKSYLAKVGPPTRSLYTSWSAYTDSIGRSGGADEDAVAKSRATALQLQQLLAALTPPPVARLFQTEMSDVVKDILTVVEDRLRLALTTPAPDVRRQVETEAGNAFYVVKQTFPDAISQLTSLERTISSP